MNAGLSQAEIARQSGISQPTINRIYSGVHVDIKAKTLLSLSGLAARHKSKKKAA